MVDTLKVRRFTRKLEGLKIPLVRALYKIIVIGFSICFIRVLLEGLGIC